MNIFRSKLMKILIPALLCTLLVFGLALAAVGLIFANLRTCYTDGKNLQAREKMALASTYAGMAFTRANVGYVHAIAHQFGGRYHTPHGLANAIMLPLVLKYSLPAVTDRLALLAVRARLGQPLDADAAFALGLVTSSPDDIDWADEVRIAIEERVSMSPDALTGMEANLRFNGPENLFTRVFGRLTAWQNWIFQRPNAVGDKGALKVYGKGDKAAFDWNRV